MSFESRKKKKNGDAKSYLRTKAILKRSEYCEAQAVYRVGTPPVFYLL